MSEISRLTRKYLFYDLLNKGEIQGNLGLLDFLGRIWPLHEISDPEKREKNLQTAIARHMISFEGDWEPEYLFFDVLRIDELPDDAFLRLLVLTVDPEVRVSKNQKDYVDLINSHLSKDGYRLEVHETLSGYNFYRPVKIATPSHAVRYLIFAAPQKPKIYVDDLLEGELRIEGSHLNYDRPIPNEGLLICHLVEWWAGKTGLSLKDASKQLLDRMQAALAKESPPERNMWQAYYSTFGPILGERLPMLLPQVYLHYDPKYYGKLELLRQRMDFLMFLPFNVRVVLEVDGQTHYTEKKNGVDVPSPRKYAEMVSEDRKLRLRGYEVYRFGGSELQEGRGERVIESFFEELFVKNGIWSQDIRVPSSH